jgi:replicative DNA helicase
MIGRLQERIAEGLVLRARGRSDWHILPADTPEGEGIPAAAPNALTDALHELGLRDVAGDAKFVPEAYLHAGRQARLDVLRGLLDAAGWVERWGSVRFSSTSARLARDVAALARSLGGWCSVHRRRRGAYVCNIHHPEPKALFSLSSKLHRALSAPRRHRRPVFTAIEPARIAETRCIAVTHPSRLYLTDGYVATHNTAFALNIAQYVGVHLRQRVLVLSLEMSAQQLVQRMLCSEAKVDSQAVRTGYLTSADWHRLTAAAGRLAEASIYIDDSAGLTVLEARAKARRLKAEHGLDLIIIDYLQLMRGRASQENRQQEISEISRSLKALAKELNVPVVALSQLSRAVEARAHRDFRPQLSDLRESGALEQDADLILFLYRQKVYKEDVAPEEEKIAEIIIGKQRNGPIGTIKLVFLPEYARFENAADLHRQPF